MIDTHCHINASPIIENWDEILLECKKVGLTGIIAPGVDFLTSKKVIALSTEYSPYVWVGVGVHPQIPDPTPVDIDKLQTLAENPHVIAIGEIGLDFEVKEPSHEIQEARIITQVELAYRMQLPILLHCRAAFKRLWEILDMLANKHGRTCPGILHSWGGSSQFLEKFLDRGYYYGVSGVITNPKFTKRRQSLQECPWERLVLETDAPYIGTHSTRKGRVTPANLPEIAHAIADITHMDVSRIQESSTQNVYTLFPKMKPKN